MEFRPWFSYGFAPMNQFPQSNPVGAGCLPRSRPGRLGPIRLVSDFRRRGTKVVAVFWESFALIRAAAAPDRTGSDAIRAIASKLGRCDRRLF